MTKGSAVTKGKSIKIKWTPDAQAALDRLKRATRESAVLKFPNFKKDFYVFSDASDLAVGGCILQESEGSLHPICFHSKVLSSAEGNYCTSDREALGNFCQVVLGIIQVVLAIIQVVLVKLNLSSKVF